MKNRPDGAQVPLFYGECVRICGGRLEDDEQSQTMPLLERRHVGHDPPLIDTRHAVLELKERVCRHRLREDRGDHGGPQRWCFEAQRVQLLEQPSELPCRGGLVRDSGGRT